MRYTAGRRRGSALVFTLVLVVSCAGLAAALVQRGIATKLQTDSRWAVAERLYLARAGIASAYLNVRAGGTGALGSAGNPVAFASGTYFVESVFNVDDTVTLTSRGRFGGSSRVVRAVIRDVAVPVFSHAMYAGNSSGDPAYTLPFGGIGTQADTIGGDVYSGNDVTVTNDASVAGQIRAAGIVTGAPGASGCTQPAPSLAAMNYETNNDVDVAAEFAGGTATNVANALGGTAWQLPQDNPAHIFRKNPDDRSTECVATSKDDYFLEDPYEALATGATSTAANAAQIGLSDTALGAPASGNHLVYFVDGNLWVNNLGFSAIAFKHGDTAGVQVTFVAKGNVYFSDDLLLHDTTKDGVAFISLADPGVPDSGNIYMGDSRFASLQEIDAFMYADRDFHDTNLDASGTGCMTVKGVMSAGNHIAIQRDFGSAHTRLDLLYDARVAAGTLALPGLPALVGGGGGHDYRIASMWAVASGN